MNLGMAELLPKLRIAPLACAVVPVDKIWGSVKAPDGAEISFDVSDSRFPPLPDMDVTARVDERLLHELWCRAGTGAPLSDLVQYADTHWLVLGKDLHGRFPELNAIEWGLPFPNDQAIGIRKWTDGKDAPLWWFTYSFDGEWLRHCTLFKNPENVVVFI